MTMSSRGSNDVASATSFPIARSFALTVLVALVVLVLLRHLFGSIRVEVGTR